MSGILDSIDGATAGHGEAVAEYGRLLSSGGYETWNTAPHLEKIWPLAQRIESERHNGKVYRRRIVVVEDWAEVEEP